MKNLDDAAIGQLIASRIATSSANDPVWAQAWVALRMLSALNDIARKLKAIQRAVEKLGGEHARNNTPTAGS